MAEPRRIVNVAEVGIRRGAVWLLDGVSFDCYESEWTLIHGPTGAGKSTLLRAINGLSPPTRGCIWTLETPIPGRSQRQARVVWRQTGTVLQEVALFETKTALENIALALRTVGRDRTAAQAQATVWLERLRLGDKVASYPCHLSGGERQRVALARAFAVAPRLLVLDEPTSALDHATAQVALEVVQELVERGTTVVMSSHRVDEIMGRCDQQIMLRQGRIAEMERHPTTASGRARGPDATPQTPPDRRVR